MFRYDKPWPSKAVMAAVLGLAATFLLGAMGAAGFSLGYVGIAALIVAAIAGVIGTVFLVRWSSGYDDDIEERMNAFSDSREQLRADEWRKTLERMRMLPPAGVAPAAAREQQTNKEATHA